MIFIDGIKKAWGRFKENPSPINSDKKEEVERRDRPILRETALGRGAVTFEALYKDIDEYNPDLLVSRKGFDIYYKMLRDPQVKAVYNLLINLLVSKNYNFQKQNDDPIQDQIVDFFQTNINSFLIGSWIQALKTILIGKAQGYSISEKIFRVDRYEGKDVWVISEIKKRPYWSFQYRLDSNSKIKRLIQNYDGYEHNLKLSKFIIYVNKPEIDPLWGESDLRAAYRPYWEKDIIQKFQNIYMERLAGGFIVAKQSKDAINLDPAEDADFKKALTNIQKATSIKLPKGYELEVIHGSDTTVFENAINLRNLEISKSLLVPNLLGLTGEQKAGSYAQARTQLETFWAMLKSESDYLADILNEQLFAQLAWWNFGEKEYPIFQFEDQTEQQKREAAEAWITAVKEGSVKNTFDDEKHTRDLLSYPPREEDKNDSEEALSVYNRFQEKESNEENFTNRMDFVTLKSKFNTQEKKFADDLEKVNNKAVKEYKKGIKKIFADLPKNKNKIDYDRIVFEVEKMPSKAIKNEFNQIIKNNLRNNYNFGRDRAKNTLKEIVKDAPQDVRKKINLAASLSKALICNKKEWSVLDFVEGITLDTAESYYNSEAFMITGDITEGEKQIISRTLINGIRDEKSISQIIDDLESQMSGKFGRARWENIARTSISNIFTQAQLAVYSDPDIKGFVDGLEYSAIMDERTTDFCRTYHGRRFKINDSNWSIITPPNHFQCFAEGTQILTDKGFISFTEITGKESFITINPKTHTIELSKAIRKITYQRKDKMLRFKDHQFDLCVTPDHSMAYIPQNSGDNYILLKEATKLIEGDIIPVTEGNIVNTGWKFKYEYVTEIDYDGMVYCVELEKYNIVYVKYNNKHTWSGNCRSVLIPLTILDTWTESRFVKSVQPQQGF